MKEKKYIVFDVDGTLLDTEFIWGEIWKQIGRKYGHPAFCHDEVVGISGPALRAGSWKAYRRKKEMKCCARCAESAFPI